MIRKAFFVLAMLTISAPAFAEPGVVIDVYGTVTIIMPDNSTKTARHGTEFPDGSSIKTGKDSSAVVFFKNGSIKRLGAGEALEAKGTPKKADATLFAGLKEAAKDSTKKGHKATAHMMVKKAGPVSPHDLNFPTNDEAMKKDLMQIDNLDLASMEATAVLKAEVYNNYGLLDSVISTLKPYCPPKACTNERAKTLMKNTYLRLNQTNLAKDYL